MARRRPAQGKADRRTAADLLRRHYIALRPDDPLGEAESWLRAARARGLPVVEAGRLVGLLSLRALFERYAEALRPARAAVPQELRALLEAERARPVRDAMAPPGETAGPSTPLPELARRLRSAGEGFIAVVTPGGRGSAMLGLVTASDLFRAARDPRFRRRSVALARGEDPQKGPAG